MLNLSQKYAFDGPNLKRDYFCYTPLSLYLVNRESNPIFFDRPRESSATSLKDSYLGVDFNVNHRAGFHAQYADSDHKRLLNLGPIALINEYRLTNSSGKEVEDIDNAHVICLMYNLKSSGRNSDNLSIGFHRSIKVRQRKMTNIKKLKEIIKLEFI